jgi:hypothetical protein
VVEFDETWHFLFGEMALPLSIGSACVKGEVWHGTARLSLRSSAT